VLLSKRGNCYGVQATRTHAYYLRGFAVNYSAAMPTYSASPSVSGAIAFGDFKQAMVIGDRGGPALQVVTDNLTQLENGVIRYYGYRRADSRRSFAAFHVLVSYCKHCSFRP